MTPALGPLHARQGGLRGLVERVESALPAGPGPALDAAVGALVAYSRAHAAAQLSELYSPLALSADPQLRSIVQELLEAELTVGAARDALVAAWPPGRRTADPIAFLGALGALLEQQRLLFDLEAQVLFPLLEPPPPFDLDAAAGLFHLNPR